MFQKNFRKKSGKVLKCLLLLLSVSRRAVPALIEIALNIFFRPKHWRLCEDLLWLFIYFFFPFILSFSSPKWNIFFGILTWWKHEEKLCICIRSDETFDIFTVDDWWLVTSLNCSPSGYFHQNVWNVKFKADLGAQNSLKSWLKTFSNLWPFWANCRCCTFVNSSQRFHPIDFKLSLDNSYGSRM